MNNIPCPAKNQDPLIYQRYKLPSGRIVMISKEMMMPSKLNNMKFEQMISVTSFEMGLLTYFNFGHRGKLAFRLPMSFFASTSPEAKQQLLKQYMIEFLNETSRKKSQLKINLAQKLVPLFLAIEAAELLLKLAL